MHRKGRLCRPKDMLTWLYLFKSSLIGRRAKGVCSDCLKRGTRYNSKYREVTFCFIPSVEPVLCCRWSLQPAREKGRNNTRKLSFESWSKGASRLWYLSLLPCHRQPCLMLWLTQIVCCCLSWMHHALVWLLVSLFLHAGPLPGPVCCSGYGHVRFLAVTRWMWH